MTAQHARDPRPQRPWRDPPREARAGDKFWVVRRANPDGSLGINRKAFRHATAESAWSEARFLARQHRGQMFMVLESLGAIVIPVNEEGPRS